MARLVVTESLAQMLLRACNVVVDARVPCRAALPAARVWARGIGHAESDLTRTRKRNRKTKLRHRPQPR